MSLLTMLVHIFFLYLATLLPTLKSLKSLTETRIHQTVVNNAIVSINRSDKINSFLSTINHRPLLPKIATTRFSCVF